MTNHLLRAGAAAGLAAGLLALGTAAASAAEPASGATARAARGSSECRAWIEERIQWPLKPAYRVGATCSSLDPDVRARGTADSPLQPDDHTAWFTRTGQTHYSVWRMKWVAAPTARMDYEPR